MALYKNTYIIFIIIIIIIIPDCRTFILLHCNEPSMSRYEIMEK